MNQEYTKEKKKTDDIDNHVLVKVCVQNFNQHLADDAVKVQKMKLAQENRKSVLCKNLKFENVFIFKYLVTLFSHCRWKSDLDIK